MSTKYNVLYNGQMAFDQAKAQLDDEYTDNYWEILPIEPLKIEEEKGVVLPSFNVKKEPSSKSTAQGFEKAEEKAIKAVQKHSMDIAGKERNKQIDEAYLLLGKARYYSQRFVPALEAFNYILENYPDSNLLEETKIWQAKTLVRLQNERLAIETLTYLLKNPRLSLDKIEQAHTAMALAYRSMDSTHLTIRHLDSAVIFSANPKMKARNLFIQGQLYRQEEKIDASNRAFDILATFKKAPLRYRVHASIERAKNFKEGDSAEVQLATLKRLIKDRDNRPFLAELYYQKGMIERANDSIDLAIKSFKKSLNSKIGSQTQQELSFEQLGNVYFDKTSFATAGAYYDSVIAIAENPNLKRIRRIIRKRANLEEVIKFETIARINDSIINIASLSKDEQMAFYQAHIDQLKKEEELARIRQENEKITTGNANNINNKNPNSAAGTFYFYNPQVAGFGKKDFKRIWGNRPLEDNWRLSDKKINRTEANVASLLGTTNFNDDKKFDITYYLSRIPTGSELDSILIDRNNAYYNLGLIYKEQFKEYRLAAEKLEKLLTFNPEEKLILPTKYNLYKIYANFDEEESIKYKTQIIKEYPDSRYATIITHPENILDNEVDTDSAESVYNDIYCDYDFQHYERALDKIEKALTQFEDQKMIPKFELLKAYVILKTMGIEAFKDALSNIAISYPNTDEGKHAVALLDNVDAASSRLNEN
ncbi:tetratricopeptide repeat protein [Flavobacteriaceae bacterium F08102]|nr:tetratricopeptide repeat protein [Flavobacteriaceae bacterium F08102]